MEEFGQRIFREHGEHSPWHDRFLFGSTNCSILVEAACKKPKKCPVENLQVAPFQFGFDLPSFESKSLKHFRATFSAAGPNSQTLPWPMKPAWYRTSPYAALVSYWNEGEIDGNRIGAEAPATWCNKFSASSRASLAAARFSAGVRVSATLFACQIE